MSKALSWGVLSTANIGTGQVIPAMQQSDLLKVTAIASRNAATAQQVAQRLGIAKAYGSYEELLADPDIDAVYNPLPNHLHVPWTIKAMVAGKHVLCEKPIALNAEQARQLIDARQRTGKQVAEAFMVRHHPQWHHAREQVRSGALGDVRVIHTLFSYYLTDPDNVRNRADIGGGGLYDVGCYAVATARYIFGSEPQRVLGLIDRDPVLGTDRLTSAIADFGNGRHLLFTCSTQLVPFQQVDICGTKARLKLEIAFNPSPVAPAQVSFDDGSAMNGGSPTVTEMPVVDHYRLQAEAFTRAVTDSTALEFPIEDAVANMRVIDAIFRSAISQTWETP